jgi:hypothetical protein
MKTFWGSGGIAPLILIFARTTWRPVASCTASTALPTGEEPPVLIG